MIQPTKKQLRKESRAHDKSARKAFREDHPSIFGRLKMKFFGGKNKSKN
tara:strand:- start:294 stop:440 length:147 start_codon:yes stop_codon:yes gene_type:complete